MNKLKVLIFALILGISSLGITKADPPDNTLIKFYSAFLTSNLNHIIENSKIIYNLSKEPTINENFLISELEKIDKYVSYANDDAANILINTMGDKKKTIDQYIKNIDEHLAQISLDIKSTENKLNKQEEFSSLILDIYMQALRAENTDHNEIIKVLDLKKLEEPVLIVPKQ